MPLVQKAVEEFFGREPHKGVNPDEVVAVGAAHPGRRAHRRGRGGAAARRHAALARRRDRRRRVHAAHPAQHHHPDASRARSSRPASTTSRSCRSTCCRASARWPPTTSRSRASSSPASRRRRAACPKIEVELRHRRRRHPARVGARTSAPGARRRCSVVPSSGLTEDEIGTHRRRGRAVPPERREAPRARRAAQQRRGAALHQRARLRRVRRDSSTPPIIKQVREDIAYLRDLIDGSGDAISIRDALQQLEQSAYKIAEAMYGSPDAGAPPKPAPSPKPRSLPASPRAESPGKRARNRARAVLRAAGKGKGTSKSGSEVGAGASHLSHLRAPTAFR